MAVLVDEILEELASPLEDEKVVGREKRQEAVEEDARGQVEEVHRGATARST